MPKIIRSAHYAIILILLLTACSAHPSTNIPPIPTSTETISTQEPTTSAPVTPADSVIPPPTATQPVEILPQAPSGPLSIVAIGDSLTQGDGDESGLNGYPTRLANLIDARRPGTQILNLGKSGWSSNDILNGTNGEAATIPEALAARPNIALVWIGSNDLWYLYEYGPEPMTKETEQQDLDNYANNIDAILQQFSKSGAKVFIALLDDQSKRPVVANPPNPSEPAFSAITADDLARMSKHVIAMNDIIQEKAAEYAAVTVDFYHTEIFTNPATLYSDGNHPNTAGYEKITQIWFSAIEAYIK
jgi:lysophospholipase L1-like esterase